MKKFIAILMTLVLVLALSATALAEEGVGTDDASGVTTVNVEVDSSNISVTVPLSFTIVAKVDGGDATVPTGYTIKNNSTIPVKVDTIAVVLTGSDWAFKSSAIATDTAPTNTGVNDIFISVNGQVLAAQSATEPTTPANWNIPAHNGTDAGTKNLTIVASTSKLDQTTTATDLITITYVISAGAHPTAP